MRLGHIRSLRMWGSTFAKRYHSKVFTTQFLYWYKLYYTTESYVETRAQLYDQQKIKRLLIYLLILILYSKIWEGNSSKFRFGSSWIMLQWMKLTLWGTDGRQERRIRFKMLVPLWFTGKTISSLGQKKYSFVSGAPGDENKSHAGGRRNIFFWKICRDKYRRKFGIIYIIIYFWSQ